MNGEVLTMFLDNSGAAGCRWSWIELCRWLTTLRAGLLISLGVALQLVIARGRRDVKREEVSGRHMAPRRAQFGHIVQR